MRYTENTKVRLTKLIDGTDNNNINKYGIVTGLGNFNVEDPLHNVTFDDGSFGSYLYGELTFVGNLIQTKAEKTLAEIQKKMKGMETIHLYHLRPDWQSLRSRELLLIWLLDEKGREHFLEN